MSNGRKTSILVILAALLLTGPVVLAQGTEYAVIVHPDNQLSDVSLAELRTIYLRQKKKWNDGSSIIVINSKPRSRERSVFDRLVLKMSPEEVSAFWIDQRIRGKGHPPRSMRSARLINRIVARNPEAIGYVPVEDVTDQVKVLRINGHKTGRLGYPLKSGKRK